MIEPGKILRTDYRRFCFTQSLDYFGALQHGKSVGHLLDRVREYLQARSELDWDITNEDKLVTLEFAKLDDAKMFMLSFSDVIYTNGVKFNE